MAGQTNDLEAFFGAMRSQDGIVVEGLLACYPSPSSTRDCCVPD